MPTLFIPVLVDAYVLPRAALTFAGGGLLVAAGLLSGRRSLGPLLWPALAVVVAAGLAAVFSIAPIVSLVGTYARYESLPMRLAYIGLLAGAAWIGERERTVTAFLAGCAVVAVEALYQAWTHSLPRPDGNLGQPNLLGALLAMAIPLALHRASRALGGDARVAPATLGEARLAPTSSHGRRALGSLVHGDPSGRGWLGLAALYAVALVFSSSRSGWLGALAGISVMAVFACRPNQRRTVIAAAALALGAAVLLVLFTPLRTLNSDPPSFRIGLWRDSLPVIAVRPLTGWGEDTMGLVFGQHQTADWVPGRNIDRAHSMPLDLAATQGIIGLGACAWLFGVWWVGVWRHREVPETAGLAGAAAAYLASVLLNFDWAPATAAFWLLAGVAWTGPEQPAEPFSPLPTRPSSGWAKGVRLLAAGAALAICLGLALVPMAADAAYYRGQLDRAGALDPWQPRYMVGSGDVDALRRAAAIGDPDPSTYVALGDAEARAGRSAAAEAAYQEALRRYPYDLEARQRIAAMTRARAPAVIGSRRAVSG